MSQALQIAGASLLALSALLADCMHPRHDHDKAHAMALCNAGWNPQGSRVIRVGVDAAGAVQLFETHFYVYAGDKRPIFWELCNAPGYAFDARRGIEVKPGMGETDLGDCKPHGERAATVFGCKNAHRRSASIAYAVRLRSTVVGRPDPAPLDPFIHNQ